MPEHQAISITTKPVTVASIQADLMALGVKPGMTLIVHSSLSRLGWVCGGAQAVILALQHLLGAAGTLVMPAHSGDWSEPSVWQNPAVPKAWWPIIRAELPAFDPALTQTREMGVIAETFRRAPDVLRSMHPQDSFAAWGRHAARTTADHQLTDGFGERSPLARLYDLDAHVLLLGVGHDNNTSLHLAEERANYPGKRYREQGAALLVDGERRWVTFTGLDADSDDFPLIGAAFAAATGLEQVGRVGAGTARLMPQGPLIDFAVGWMEQERGRIGIAPQAERTFMQFKTTDFCDMYADIQVAEPLLRHYGGAVRFHGPIATLKVFEDNSLVRSTLEGLGNGRVLVVDGGGSLRSALVGDQLGALAVQNGWAGVVVNGCVRDVAELAELPVGVLALASHPRRSDKRGAGQADLPVRFAGVHFTPGHYLYADADGLVVATAALAAE